MGNHEGEEPMSRGTLIATTSVLSKIKWKRAFQTNKRLVLHKVLWSPKSRLPWVNNAVQEPRNQKDRGALGSAPSGKLDFRG
jgi:hypothetical protein